MSQSDYIQYKKASQELEFQYDFSSVINSNDYTRYKQFTLENTIYNTVPQYNQLVPTDLQVVFGMERPDASGCATFLLCSGTEQRTYRTPMLSVYFTPSSYVRSYVKRKKVVNSKKYKFCVDYCNNANDILANYQNCVCDLSNNIV